MDQIKILVVDDESRMRKLVHDFLAKQGIFDADYTSQMIREYLICGDGGPATGANYSKLAWSFFVFQQWYQHYMV